jgi:hypothetical protein
LEELKRFEDEEIGSISDNEEEGILYCSKTSKYKKKPFTMKK